MALQYAWGSRLPHCCCITGYKKEKAVFVQAQRERKQRAREERAAADEMLRQQVPRR